MKVESVRGTSSAQPSQRARPAAASGFAPAAQAASAPGPIASVSGVAPTPALDALLALQGGVEPDRAHRQARRGKRLLDALEKLARALIEGAAPASLRTELEALHGQAAPSGDSGLDAILLEIDIRAAVELAKLEGLRARA